MSAHDGTAARTRRPGPALAALTAATFTLGVNGFVMAGVLPAIGRDLGVGIATAGQLVTVFGVVYAVAAPLVAPRAAARDRRTALVAAMGVFTAASVASALAPTFPVLVAARVLAGAAAAAVTPVAVAAARELVPAERAGRAVAGVFGGMTVALVLGVPVGSLVGNAVSWRATFVLVALGGAATTAVLTVVLPGLPPAPRAGTAGRLRLLRSWPVVANLGVTVVWMAGGIAVFTYVGVLLPPVTGVGAPGLSGLLLLYGVACVVGNWAGGVGTDRWGADRTAVASLLLTAGALVLLGLLAAVPHRAAGVALAVAAVAVWGFGDWSITAPQVQRLTALAPEAATELLALNSSAIYVGVTAGAAVGGVLVATFPVPVLPFAGGLLQLLALGLVVLGRPGREPRTAVRVAATTGSSIDGRS